VLTGTGLTLWRGSSCLFDELSFTVRRGAALLVQGANGSGKTTLLRVIAGLTQPEQGEVRLDGHPMANRARESGRATFAYSGHAAALKPSLTTRENLAFYADLSGFDRAAVGALAEEVGLGACIDLPVQVLSAGQKRRAALARVRMSGAPVWLLDEPHANLDVDGRRLLTGILRTHLQDDGIAVIAAHDPLEIGGDATAVLNLGFAT